MSRHSKWSKIKHQKGAEDAKRGALFTRLAKAIMLAAREGGSGDPKMNFKLRLAIDQARVANLPKENVERAIQKGLGSSAEGATIERAQYEGFLPGGAAIIIDSLTDNKNRTSGVIKHLLGKYGGNLGGPNSVLRMFEKRGVIKIKNEKLKMKNEKERITLLAIESGAEDIGEEGEEDDELTIYTKPENLQTLKDGLEKENINLDYTEIELLPKEKLDVQGLSLKKDIENLLNELDDNEEINNYYTNLGEF